MVLRSDGEPAITQLTEAIAATRIGRTIPEKSAPGESSGNGAAEEVGKSVREVVRTLKDQVEWKTGMEFEGGEDVLPWLVRWGAMLYSRCVVREDGKTAYERLKGRKCNMEVVPFGEMIFFKQLRDGQGGERKMDTEWSEGIWLGHANGQPEYLLSLIHI